MSVSKNKVAIITGSARRLGKDIAKSLAANGFDLVLHYNTSPRSSVEKIVNEFIKQGIVVCTVKADLSKSSGVKKLFAKVKSEFGRLDLLVNNASIFRKVDFFDIDEKIFDEFVNTNLKSVLLCTVEAAKLMNKSKEKNLQIINIASLGGILNWVEHIPYSIAKAGVIKLTQLTAKRLAPKILVNAIAPGTILIENDANKTVVMKEKEKYPLKHFGKSKDITSVINFLVNENSFITGHTFIVDGGRAL